MLKVNKKQVKLISVLIALIFVLGIVGIALSQNNRVSAAPSSEIGVVDFGLLMSQHPDTAAADSAMRAATESAKKDFDAKAASMNDQDKQNYYLQVQQQLNAKQQELLKPIRDKVLAAVKSVADAKGMTVVIDKGDTIYGGQDITAEVGKKLGGQ